MFKQFAAAALAISISTGALAADQFKSSTFLNWTAKQQEGFVTASLAMAAAIAPSRGKCIDAWNGKAQANGYTDLITTMRKYPDYHPTAVVLAVIERDCGSITIAQH